MHSAATTAVGCPRLAVLLVFHAARRANGRGEIVRVRDDELTDFGTRSVGDERRKEEVFHFGRRERTESAYLDLMPTNG